MKQAYGDLAKDKQERRTERKWPQLKVVLTPLSIIAQNLFMILV